MQEAFSSDVTMLTAFIAGLLSFLSPCVLPLIPGYISYLSGASLKDLRDEENIKKLRWSVLFNALAFSAGFSIIFISLGAAATAIGSFMNQHISLLSKIAGIIIIILGLHLTGIIKIKALYMEKRFQAQSRPGNIFQSIILGMAFGFGWTPCIGPLLAAILSVAASQDTVLKGITLLTVYSLGLAIPFLLAAYSLTFFFKWFDKIRKYFNIIEWISGGLLIAIGVLMLTGGLTKIAASLSFLDQFAK